MTSTPPSATRALAISGLVAVAYVVAFWTPVPGVTYPFIEFPLGCPPPTSVMLIGVAPWLAAYLIVELACLVVPAWRPLRFETPRRKKMATAVQRVWFLIAFIQAYSIAAGLGQMQIGGSPVMAPGPWALVFVTLTLIAGSAMVGLLGRLASRHGLGSGLALLVLLETATHAVSTFIASPLNPNPTLDIPPSMAVGLLGVVIGTLWLLRARRPTGLPLLVAGVVPTTVARSLWTLVSLIPATGLVWAQQWPAMVLCIASTLVLGYMQHRPDRLAAQWRVPASLLARDLRLALLVNIAFTVGLFALTQHGVANWRTYVEVVVVVMSVPIVLDLVQELRARNAGQTAIAWEFARVSDALIAKAKLHQAGLPADTRGLNFRLMTHLFGPHVPLQLLVRPTDVDAVRHVLATPVGTDPNATGDAPRPEGRPSQPTSAPSATPWDAPGIG